MTNRKRSASPSSFFRAARYSSLLYAFLAASTLSNSNMTALSGGTPSIWVIFALLASALFPPLSHHGWKGIYCIFLKFLLIDYFVVNSYKVSICHIDSPFLILKNKKSYYFAAILPRQNFSAFCLQRLTERTFYGVTTLLSGSSLRDFLSGTNPLSNYRQVYELEA